MDRNGTLPATPPAIVGQVEETTEQLVAGILEGCHRWQKNIKESLEESRKLGALLIRLKARLGRGEWFSFVAQKFPFTNRTARRFMAKARDAQADTLSACDKQLEDYMAMGCDENESEKPTVAKELPVAMCTACLRCIRTGQNRPKHCPDCRKLQVDELASRAPEPAPAQDADFMDPSAQPRRRPTPAPSTNGHADKPAAETDKNPFKGRLKRAYQAFLAAISKMAEAKGLAASKNEYEALKRFAGKILAEALALTEQVRPPEAGVCRECKAPVVWHTTQSYKRIPLEHGSHGGNYEVIKGVATKIKEWDKSALWMSHYLTCPKKKEKTNGQA